MDTENQTRTRSSVRRQLYLLTAAFVSGAAVMALELLGTRLLAPTFGLSLPVWAAIIAVTLTALAIGYAVGGYIADRTAGRGGPPCQPVGRGGPPCQPVLSGALCAAGLLLLALSIWGRAVPLWWSEADLRWGALASAAVLLGPPMMLFGAVMPLCLKSAATGLETLGLTAGRLYAASTLGSVAGTLLTALWWLPSWGTQTSLCFLAAIVLATGLIGWVGSKHPKFWWAGGLVGWWMVTTFHQLTGSPTHQLTNLSLIPHPSSLIRPVAQRDSWYGEIAVFDDDEARFLLIDGMLHTAMPHAPAEITGRCHLFTERYYLELLPYYRPTAKRGLLIGLGGGLLPQVLQGYGLEMDAVEIDPVVVGFARTHFHYTGPVVVADGRQYVQQTEGAGTGARTYDWAGAEARPYDFVVLDAYCSDVAPFHLGTREMFASVRRVLTPGGVLAINHVGRPRGFATACLVRTLRAVFAHVEVFATEPGDDVQFLAVFASDAPLRLPETPEQVWNRTHPGDTLPAPPFASIEARRVLVPPDAGAVVTDDRHPAERDWAEVSRAWREKTRRLLGAM